MKIKEKIYKGKASLGIIDTKKFKNDYLTLCYLLPLTEENISGAGVLAGVMLRGTKKHPSILEINRHLLSLYDPSVSVYVSKHPAGLCFKVSLTVLDGTYVPDKLDVFGGSLDFVRDMLLSPLACNGEMDASYTESEKKRALDRIKAEINNKDKYALKRATEIAYEGTPMALGENGTEESVNAVTPSSLYELISYITACCPLYVAFAGNCTEGKMEKLDTFINALTENREEILPQDGKAISLPVFGEAKHICESISAKQGRMVLSYAIDTDGADDVKPMIFDEIFGASPVSRLFVNVRERLQLCYYCASGCNIALGRMTVRSGLDKEKRDLAMQEIERQLALLSDENGITEEELEIAKKSRISIYTALGDSCARYAEWYIQRRLLSLDADADAVIEKIKGVSQADVARVARSVRLQLSYFLDGSEK